LFSTGCAMDASEHGADVEAVGEVSQAFTGCPAGTSCFDYSTGGFTVRIYQCPWRAGDSLISGNHLLSRCYIGSDHALIGGGAEIQAIGGGDAEPGALLTSSRPDGDFAWVASSKDHIDIGTHVLRAYAIGLRHSSLSVTTLKANIKIKTDSSSVASASPDASSTVDDGFVLLSGGAQAITTGSGLLLTRSYPTSATTWYAQAKDHQVSSPGTVRVWSIGIKQQLTASIGVTTSWSSWWSSTGGGYRSTTISNGSPWVTVGVGANQEWSGSGRLLTDMFPLMSGQGGVFATSKDHEVSSSGRVLGYAMAMRQL
jgi:hypothetical protein